MLPLMRENPSIHPIIFYEKAVREYDAMKSREITFEIPAYYCHKGRSLF